VLHIVANLDVKTGQWLFNN